MFKPGDRVTRKKVGGYYTYTQFHKDIGLPEGSVMEVLKYDGGQLHLYSPKVKYVMKYVSSAFNLYEPVVIDYDGDDDCV